MANNRIDKINVGGADYDLGSTNFVFDTYAEYQAAYSAGDIPVGSVVYIKEGSTDDTITALQVVYNNGSVKSALDKLNNDLAVISGLSVHGVANDSGFSFSELAIVYAGRNGNAARGMWLIDRESRVFPIFTAQGSINCTCTNRTVTLTSSLDYYVPYIAIKY